jgi:hypothetical protein
MNPDSLSIGSIPFVPAAGMRQGRTGCGFGELLLDRIPVVLKHCRPTSPACGRGVVRARDSIPAKAALAFHPQPIMSAPDRIQ